jgi:hypothetical protein
MEDVDIFYGHLVNSMALWYIYPVLVCCSKQNVATLMQTWILFAGDNKNRN